MASIERESPGLSIDPVGYFSGYETADFRVSASNNILW